MCPTYATFPTATGIAPLQKNIKKHLPIFLNCRGILSEGLFIQTKKLLNTNKEAGHHKNTHFSRKSPHALFPVESTKKEG